MNFLKNTLLVSFCFVAAFCVGYAHSTATTLMKFKSNDGLFEACGLNVKVEAGKPGVQFIPVGVSSTAFNGFWPQSEGKFTWKNVRGQGDFAKDLEILEMTFQKVNGVLQPVRYDYEDLRHITEANHQVFFDKCTSLTVEH
jgi:hypothetical protein